MRAYSHHWRGCLAESWLPDCCFLEADIVALALPTDFNRIGSPVQAANKLKLLIRPKLRITVQEAFLKCASLGGFHSCFTGRVSTILQSFHQWARIHERAAARVCAPAKSSKKSSNGLHITITSNQRPLHSKTWSRRKSGALV